MSSKAHREYQARTDLLTGRTVLVTGANRGLGKAVALAFAEHGATCILMGRNVEGLESVFDDIMTAGGPEPAIYPLDHLGATAQDYEVMAERIDSSLGPLTGIVLNAAVQGTIGPIDHSDAGEFTEVMQVNVAASYQITRACLPLLKRAEYGRVIYTTADLGRVGRAFRGAYSISKFAIEGLTQVISDEVAGTQVTANAVNPGPIRTAMRADAFPAEDPKTVTQPSDILATYLYLMGPDSAEVNGQSLDAQ